jgi:alpha-amylase
MKRIFTFMMLLMVSTAISLAQDTWTVAGTAAALNGTASWAQTNADNDMTSSDGVNYTLTVTNCTLEASVTYEYKVVKNHDWGECYPSQNKSFMVAETAIYTVVYHFNADTKAVNEEVTKTGNAGEVTHIYSLAGSPATVFGAAWDEKSTTTEMQLGTDGKYWWKANDVTLAEKTKVEFKVVVDHDWGEAYPSSNFTVTIEENGTYDLTCTFEVETKKVDCIVEKKGSADVESVFIIAGNLESLFGTTWDGSNEANKMEKVDGIWTKEYKNVSLTTTPIEWKVVQNGTSWIPDGEGNNLMVYIPQDGTYDLIFTYNEATQEPKSKLMQDGKEITYVPVPTGEGWPANYGGVMLQGFYWNSFEDTKLTELQKQVDDISTYFDLVWLPNTGATGGEGMGYLPVYWLNHNSNFGRQNTLKKLIAAFNAKGTKVIEDVVLNHKAPKGVNDSWVDFVNEKWTHDGITEEINWTPADICRNDDGGYTNTMGADPTMVAKNGGWECTGADDTGDDFSGGRDLDHTGENVQKNCITYLNYLQKELGYSGYRLDMVKGYSAYYTKMYNDATQPEFCVGEYWDGKEAITNWIAGTGMTSAAFDFPFKYQMKEAFSNGNWSALDWKGIAEDTYWQRYAVTFIDNHDTYENESKHVHNVLGANAFMLAMPGTPCVFLKHWQRYPIAIGNMILARKAAGITNQSPIVDGGSRDGGYFIKVQGEKGTVLCIAGFVNFDTTGFKLISSGANYAYFVSDNITVEGLREGSDDEEAKELTVYVECAEAPYIYSWNSAGQPTNGEWPGTQLTTTVTKEDGKTFWARTFTTSPVNIVINNGGRTTTNDEGETVATGEGMVQTADIVGLTHDSYFTFDPTNTDKETNWTDITNNYYTPEPIALPACAKDIEDHLFCYFQGNKDYDSPRAWAWNDGKNFCGEWPGVKLTRVGDDGNGHLVWLWDAGDYMDLFDTYTPDPALFPSNILFNNGSEDPKTADFVFQNGGYYDATGLLGCVEKIPDGINATTINTAIQPAVIYNLQGQKVSTGYRGIVVSQGRKIMVK